MPKYGNLLIQSYTINGLLASSIYVGLYAFRKKLKNHIGFLFMGGSFLKFIFFFILFYPTYSADGDMDKIEFAAFFVPYLVSLILETFFMAQMLKKLD
jgi:F0F1-type ATP synthase assembly protein I